MKKIILTSFLIFSSFFSYSQLTEIKKNPTFSEFKKLKPNMMIDSLETTDALYLISYEVKMEVIQPSKRKEITYFVIEKGKNVQIAKITFEGSFLFARCKYIAKKEK